MKKTNYEQVLEFHEKFNVRIGKKGHIPSPERILLRIRLMSEELAEVIEAMELSLKMPAQYVNVAKELADLLYTVYGSAAEYGIPIDEVYAEVHKSNMTKEENKEGDAKITKGDCYEPPDIVRALKGNK